MLQGRNACVIAYGQTGAGKSYTMFGELVDAAKATANDARKLGLVPRAVYELFEKSVRREHGREPVSVCVSVCATLLCRVMHLTNLCRSCDDAPVQDRGLR